MIASGSLLGGWVCLASVVCLLVAAGAAAGQGATYVPTTAQIHDATLKDLGDGSFEIVTTGSDPYLFLKATGGKPTPGQHVLAFEYAAPQGTDVLEVYVYPPLDQEHSVTGQGLSLAEGWTSHSIDIKAALDRTGGKWDGLRIDPGAQPGKLIRIRNIHLREPNARELEMAAREVARKAELAARDARMTAYLRRKFSASVTEVAVGADRIAIRGKVGTARGPLFLAEAPLWQDVTALRNAPTLVRIPAGKSFSLRVARRDGARDRLTSRWAVVRRSGAGLELVSSARYPDRVQAAGNPPEERPRGKKGLGGFGPWGSIVSDLDDLDISAVTINILLNGLIDTMPAPGRSPFAYDGTTYYISDAEVKRIDEALAETSKRHIVVSAIILLAHGYNAPRGSWSQLTAHPDAHPSGIFVMPNMDSPEGLRAYAAGLEYLARRYSRGEPGRGRIHHWILHNEINAGWIWTNAGDKTDTLYMDLYHRSMRLAHLIARQYDPHAQAFISLEHHWNYTPEPRFYTGKRLLELLNSYCRQEGDFDWALAHHPYPDSLLVPRTWEDGHTTFALDTPKITFRNMEVLQAWAERPENKYLGKVQRTIHCTEQGLNSPDYSEKSLAEQAAGMAYTWTKLERLSAIEAFQYHAWLDNRAEFGLRIGLRKFVDEPGDGWGKKPIWYVFQAAGTPRQAEVFAPYLPVVGMRSWEEAVYKGAIR